MRVRPIFALLLLCFLAIPAFAASSGCPDPIRSLTPTDAQTGTPVTISWSLGGLVPQSQTISGHDFDTPVVVAPNQLTYTYTPTKPGEKHVTLTVVTDCGTFNKTATYHVKECNVVTPTLNVDKTSVAPGETIHASIDLLPGHTARWVVTNGTASATSGASIQVVAGASGSVTIDVFVARGNSCEVATRAIVAIVQPCPITEPAIQQFPSDGAAAANPFSLFIPTPRAGETYTFASHGADVLLTQPNFFAVMAPATGSFTIDVTVTKSGCSRTFSHTYTVSPCNPTATVSKGASGSCASATLIADFTGRPPFQGYWSDGQYFFTNSTHLERTVTIAGTYTISNFLDASCSGTVTGSAQIGASLPTPQFTLDDIVGGFFYGTDTCPGMTRTARLTTPIPAGAEVVWSIENGTILAGQGTDVVQFAGTSPGPSPLSVVFRDASGCSTQAARNPYILTQGTPEISVSVEPSTIPLGGTAIVTFTRHNNYVRGFDVSSSLGDPIVFLGASGESVQYEYRSIGAGGAATITAYANNACNVSTTATTTLTIDSGTAAGARARVRGFGTSCENYGVIAELSGVAPFTGKWSNGETFTVYDPYAFLFPTTGGTYTLVEFADANGPGTITGDATFNFTGLPRPEFTITPESACPNGTATATLTTPIPDGATVNWTVYGATILSGQGTGSIAIQLAEFGVSINVQITAPGACSPIASAFYPVDSYVQQPLFDLYGVFAGTSTDFYVTLDPHTATWSFENSMGDAMEIVGNPYPNTYIVRYTSSHGPGESNVRIFGTTQCGTSFEATRVMNVLPPPPSATLTSEAQGSCGALVTATLSGGAAPYTLEWSDGETLTTSDTTVTHVVHGTQYVYLIITDTSGQRVISNYLYVETAPMQPMYVGSTGQVCPGGTTTVTAYNAPADAEIIWTLNGSNARIVSGQGTTELVVEGIEAGYFNVTGRYRTTDGCESNNAPATFINVLSPVANPVITLPASSITAGSTIDLTVTFEGGYQDLNWENSMGDALFNIGQNNMTFTLRYISQNGPGTSTIRAYGTTNCGQLVESTVTLTITP